MIELTPGVRCFVEPVDAPLRPKDDADRRGWRTLRYGERVLVFDIETTTDASQRLLVGGYLLATWTGGEADEGSYEVIERGLFLGDGLSRAGKRCVREYAAHHGLRLLSREEFCSFLISEGYDLGALIVGFNLPFDLGALAVHWAQGRRRWRRGFRLSLASPRGRRTRRGLRASAFEPAVLVRSMDGPRAVIRWGSFHPADMARREGGGRRPFEGRFLDLRRWASVLWGKVLTLEGACQKTGIAYRKRAVRYGRVSPDLLDYLCDDINASWLLFQRLRAEWNALPFTRIPSPVLPLRSRAEDTPDLDPSALLPHRLQSSAGIAKGLLQRIGVVPLLKHQPTLPRDTLGIFMSTLHGGWTEAHIQRVIVPVRLVDISSTYLIMAVLLGLWDVLAADRVEVVDDTAPTLARLECLRPEDLLRPETWRDFLAVCLVEPEGGILPIQANVDSSWLLMLNRVHAAPGTAFWWALPDVLASFVRTGRMPRIRKVLRVVPHGRQKDLFPMTAWGITLDPMGDPFRDLLRARIDAKERAELARAAGDTEVERRESLRASALKAVAEPMAYGVHCEVDDAGEEGETVRVWAGGREPILSTSPHGERPGPYFNPLVAPFPPAACRLAMALMEAAIRERGGTWAANDTDSFSVISTKEGGLIRCPGGTHRLPDGREAVRALSYDEVDALRDRFALLAPCGGPFWKLEPENTPHPEAIDRSLYAYIAGPKRFCFFNVGSRGRIILRKWSNHALGHLKRPEWIAAMWEAAVRAARGDRRALDTLPDRDTPAAFRLTLSRPDLLTRGARKDGLRPFAFVLTVPVRSPWGGAAFPEGRCRLLRRESTGCPEPSSPCPYRSRCDLARPLRVIAPYEPRAERWKALKWRDLRTGRAVDLTWGRSTDSFDGSSVVQTLGDLAREYLALPDPRYIGPDGLPGHPATRGEMRRADVRLVPDPIFGAVVPLSKHQRRLALVRAGIASRDETTTSYAPVTPDVEKLRAWCHRHPAARIAEVAHMKRETVSRFRAGRFATLDADTLARLYYALLYLDAESHQDEVLRAALRAIPVQFICVHAKFNRRRIYRYRRGQIRRLRPEHARALWKAVAAWVAEHPEAGLVLPQGVEDASAREAAP